MRNIVPRIPGVNTLGTPAKRWGAIYADQIVLPDNKTLLEILSGQDTTIEEVLGQQNLAIANALAAQDTEISNRLGEQDAEIDSRLAAQESIINQLSAQKVDKTTYDDDMALKANQVDLEALAGTSEIVASGDNYVRWSNGLQICWGKGSITYNKGSSATKNITLPNAFKSANDYVTTVAFTSTPTGWLTTAFRISNDSGSMFHIIANNAGASATEGFNWQAIGYWK